MVNRVRTPDSRTLLSPRCVHKAPDAGGTTSNLKAIGSNPIRRESAGSSEVEQQEGLATICRRLYLEIRKQHHE